MSNATSAKTPGTRTLHPLAAVLSYLIPGVGQIVQGRVGKGLLFFFCVYGLFFYGMYLGSGTETFAGETYKVTGSVYLPDLSKRNPGSTPLSRLPTNLYNRPQYLGQFWAGIVSWPALIQYFTTTEAVDDNAREIQPPAHPILGRFQQTPLIQELNVLHTSGDKRRELAWVYTVIAGVLNVLVIYDALAGPALLSMGNESKSRSAKLTGALMQGQESSGDGPPEGNPQA